MSRVGRTAPVLLTLMIEPPPSATIRSPTSADSRNGPFRLTAITLSKSSSVTSLIAPYMGERPALLTRTSTRANSPYTSSTSVARSSQRPTWHAHAAALPPSARSAAATSAHTSALRLTTTTCAPARANARAIARPSPRVAPVMTATRPERSNRRPASSSLLTVSAGSCRAATSWVSGLGVVATGEVCRWPRQRRAGAPPGARQLEARGPVVGDALGHEPGVEQEIEVAEHLPHDEQRLLAHRARRPQLPGDRIRGAGPRLEHRRDALAAPPVVGEPLVDEAGVSVDGRAVTRQQPLEGHARGAVQARQVLDAGA